MKIILFGMGSIGKRHFRLLNQAYPDYHYYAYKRKPQSDIGDSMQYIYSWNELEQLHVDLAMICNPTSQHIATALECAKRNINLFIEKPLSHDLSSVNELMHLVNEKGLKTMVGYNLRFHPVVEKAKKFVEDYDQEIIRFSAFCGSYLPDWREMNYKDVYSSKKELGGGVVLDLSHEIDYCKWIFGKPENIISYCSKYSSLDINVEDNAEIIFQYKDKVGLIHLDYTRILPRRDLEITTETSIFYGDLISGYWSITSRNNIAEGKFDIKPDITYGKQIIRLVEMIDDGAEISCNLNDAVETQQILQKVKGENN